jgi:AraC family transcriptional regulator
MTSTIGLPRTSIASVLSELPDAPVATSRNRGWDGVTLDLHNFTPSYSVALPPRDHHLVCYCPSGRGRMTQQRAGRRHESVIMMGMSIVMPSGHDSIWEGEAACTARLRIPSELVARASEEIDARTQVNVEIANVFQTWDPVIERLARILLEELSHAAHPAQAMIVSSVSCALAAHLLRSYNAFDPKFADGLSVLSRRKLSEIECHINEHIEETIGLSELAEIAGVSRFHFARIFKRSTGLTPMAYVERSRLLRAQELIKAAEHRLAEVALAVGFADQSHFTRRFRRLIGCTPAAFAKDYGSRWISSGVSSSANRHRRSAQMTESPEQYRSRPA